jgi:hypothetical protein
VDNRVPATGYSGSSDTRIAPERVKHTARSVFQLSLDNHLVTDFTQSRCRELGHPACVLSEPPTGIWRSDNVSRMNSQPVSRPYGKILILLGHLQEQLFHLLKLFRLIFGQVPGLREVAPEIVELPNIFGRNPSWLLRLFHRGVRNPGYCIAAVSCFGYVRGFLAWSSTGLGPLACDEQPGGKTNPSFKTNFQGTPFCCVIISCTRPVFRLAPDRQVKNIWAI